jgi:uncharacterized protein (TIGR00290 family)
MWSGGKDGALALRRATARGLAVARLISFYDATTARVRFHGTPVAMLRVQAAALRIDLSPIGTVWTEMEARLVQELGRLRAEGFEGVVFGDIHLADVRAWYEAKVTAAGLEHVEPLWGEEPASLLEEYVRGGGRAVVTCVDLERLDASWLGRVVDERFAADIAATGVDPCGENGEYHSFAFAGPEFHDAVSWAPGERRGEGRFQQLDVRSATMERPQRLGGLVDG